MKTKKKVSSFIKKGLEQNNYIVETAFDGKEALQKVLLNEYDFLILDIMIPFYDGITLVKEIRKNNIYTPILLLTALDTVKDKVTGLDSGTDDYLTKPFSFDELLARIRALSRRKKVQQKPLLRVNDLTLDLISHRVFRNDAEIIVSQKEYSILEYLMKNKNKIVSKTAIVNHIYDYNFDSSTNIIEVYINKLRQKIDNNSGPKLIHTIRGMGYMIKEIENENN